MNRRKFTKSLAMLSAMGVTGNFLSGCKGKSEKLDFSVSTTGSKVKIHTNAVEKMSKVMFLADSHISYFDGLVEPYSDYAKRMYKAFAKMPKIEILDATFKKAEKENFDLILLGGDIINFPSDYNVKRLKESMEASKVPVKYIAGNHDWHFEGSGIDIAQTQVRKNWMKKLEPLFFGEDYDCYKVILNGVKFLMVDDSAHDISQKQLDWAKRELSDGMPAIFAMHIPLYVEGRYYDCGNAKWGFDTDRGYRIERRQRHPVRQTPQTFEFRDLVFNSPNVLGVLAGHTHRLAYDYLNGKFQAVCDRFIDKGEYITLEICPKA